MQTPRSRHSRRVQSFFDWMLIVVFSFSGLYFFHAWYIHAATSMFVAACMFTYGCVLAIARSLAFHGRIVVALMIVFLGMLITSLSVAALLPPLGPALVIVPLLALTLILAYCDGWWLFTAISLTWGSSTAIVAMTQGGMWSGTPATATDILYAITVSVTIGLICILLAIAQYHMRDMFDHIQAQHQQINAAFLSMDDGLLATNQFGLVTFANPAAAPLLKCEIDAAIDQPLQQVVRFPAELAFPLSADPITNHNYRDQYGQYHYVSVRVSTYPLIDSHESGHLYVMRDITAQQQWQIHLQETQRLESLGVLAGGVAHDFNNILSTIFGNVSIAQEEIASTHEAQASLEQIVVAARRAAELTKQMLLYAGRSQVVFKQTDVHTLVRETISLVRISIPKHVRIRNTLPDSPCFCPCDPTQIRQVIMNLLLNASESIPSSGGSITLQTSIYTAPESFRQVATSLKVSLKPGTYLMLEVCDTGHGMSPEVSRRIFEPFFSTKRTGRGLGLAAVAGIMIQHGGGIAVTSQIQVGSTFHVYLSMEAMQVQTATVSLEEKGI